MAQLSSNLRYLKESCAYNSSYHKQPDDPFHAPDMYHWMNPFNQYTKIGNAEDSLFDSCMSQLSNDIRYSKESSVVPSLYHKQPDGPFNAPEIIRGAALTDVLRLQI